MNFSLITLGELLSSKDDTIKRNAFSILKQLQKERDREVHWCYAEHLTGRHAGLSIPHVHAHEQDKAKYCTYCGYVEVQYTKNCVKCRGVLTSYIHK